MENITTVASLTAEQMRAEAKALAWQKLEAALATANAELVEPFTSAISVTVNGQEIWVEVKLTAKQWKPSKVSPAYDPFEKAEEYRLEKAAKDVEKNAKAAIKAAKIARDDDKRRKNGEG